MDVRRGCGWHPPCRFGGRYVLPLSRAQTPGVLPGDGTDDRAFNNLMWVTVLGDVQSPPYFYLITFHILRMDNCDDSYPPSDDSQSVIAPLLLMGSCSFTHWDFCFVFYHTTKCTCKLYSSFSCTPIPINGCLPVNTTRA